MKSWLSSPRLAWFLLWMAVSSQRISFHPFVPWDRLEQKRALLVSALSLRILLNVSFQNPLHPPGGRSRSHEGTTPDFRHFPTIVPDSYLFRAVDPFPPLSTPLLFPMNPTRTREKKNLHSNSACFFPDFEMQMFSLRILLTWQLGFWSPGAEAEPCCPSVHL